VECRWEGFPVGLLAPSGRSERRHRAKVCLRGLLRDVERKSIEPTAGRTEGADVQTSRRFIGQIRGRWCRARGAVRESRDGETGSSRFAIAHKYGKIGSK